MAQLHVEMLSRQRSRNTVLSALKKLPASLEETYKDVMERISKQDAEAVDLALKVLSWITYAKEPLSAKMLQHAVAATPGMTTLNDGDLTDVDDLVSLCAGIVTIDRERNIVRLVHYTTQSYLEKHLMDRKVDIAHGCLTYLGLEVFREPCRCERKDLENRIDDYPFVRYAAIYWSDHIRWELENELKSLCLLVFKWQGSRDALYQTEHYLTGWDRFNYVRERSLLHMFAASGLTVLCRNLLDNRVDGNEMYHYSIYES